MNDDVLTKTGHAQPDAAQLAAFALLILFVALVVLLGIGLTLNPREIPSPLIGKPVPETFVIDRNGRITHKVIGPLTSQLLQETILPLIRELRK